MLATLMLCNVAFAMLGSSTSPGIAVNSANSLRPIFGLVVLALSLTGLNQTAADALRTNWLQDILTPVDVTEFLPNSNLRIDNSPSR